MPCRSGPTGGNTRAAPNRRGNAGGIRKTTRNRQAPYRYGQQIWDETNSLAIEEMVTLESESEQTEASGYTNPAPSNPQPASSQHATSQYMSHSTASLLSEIPVLPHPYNAQPESPRQARESISLHDMRELLRAHEDDIVNQDVERLRSADTQTNLQTPSHSQPRPCHAGQP